MFDTLTLLDTVGHCSIQSLMCTDANRINIATINALYLIVAQQASCCVCCCTKCLHSQAVELYDHIWSKNKNKHKQKTKHVRCVVQLFWGFITRANTHTNHLPFLYRSRPTAHDHHIDHTNDTKISHRRHIKYLYTPPLLFNSLIFIDN